MKKYQVIFSQAAEMDLQEIVNFYQSRNREYSIELFRKIRSRISELNEYPERGRQVPELEQQGIEKYRELIEGNYRIVFSISESIVAIHSIVDSRRNLEEILVKKILSHYEK